MSVGTSLRHVRDTAGLTVSELARRTRIPASVIEDLERDNFATSGGPAYARGHIRTIARICNVDDAPILSQFESQTIPLNKSIRDLLNDSNVTRTVPERKPLSWRALSGVVAGIALLALVGTTIFSLTGGSSGNRNNQVTSSQNSSDSDQTGPVATNQKGVAVELTGVNGLSWVAVTDSAGVTQYSGRIRQGEKRSFQDNQLLYLVIGNAGAVSLNVNGENLGVPGAIGEVVRLEFGPQAQSTQG